MSRQTDTQSSETSNDPRKIGKWAHTYARNRSLSVIVFMLIFLVLWAAISIPSYYGGMAYRAANWPLFWLCIAILVVATVAVVYLSVPKWGGKLIEQITERLYAREGKAQLVPPCSSSRRRIVAIVVAVFAMCILALVVLGLFDFFSQQYMQPISAICCVPFLVALWLLMRPAVGPIALLWPALYALHEY